MKLKFALLAAAGSIALGSAASAGEGWYGALGAGYTLSNDEVDLKSADAFPSGPNGPGFDTDYDLDEALNIYGAIGKYFKQGFRGELEFATRTQNVDELKGDGLGFAGFASDGDIGEFSMTTYMINVYKDLDFGGSDRVDPYVGAGIGLARMRSEVNNLGIAGLQPANAPTDPYRGVIGDQDTSVAYQAMAGLVFDVAENIDFDVRYRYLLTGDMKYGGFVNDRPASFNGQYSANELTAGFRWNWGASAPAPAPAPVSYKDCWDGSRVVMTSECPPEIVEAVDAPKDLALTVYFDYDKSNLTDAAQRLIRDKSAEALEYDISSVSVEGNTDTSGSAAYNNALSSRRASVVQDALVANGVPGDLISSSALGENNPAKPTSDGVREPLNRRTEVEFKF